MGDSSLPRRRFAPRFSLAAALIAMTLCAIGLWYWFRVPFEVEHEKGAYREVETVRRTWGGTVRHGPRRIMLEGRLKNLETYRDGIKHGRQEWFDREGRVYLAAEFRAGRLVSFSASEDYDQRLARLLAEGTIDKGRIAIALFDDVHLEFIETPLKDVIDFLQDAHGIPLTCQGLRRSITLSKAHPPQPPRPPSEVVKLNEQMQLLVPLDPEVPATQIDLQVLPVVPVAPRRPKVIRQANLPVTASVRDAPLIVGLGKILRPHDLVCDYRYGMLWIAEREGVENWKDPTGTQTLIPPAGSKLAKTWEEKTVCEFIDTPLDDALQYLFDTHFVKFDSTRIPKATAGDEEIVVTVNLSGLSFKHTLGALLDSVDCQARLDGETIVIELQPDHPLAGKTRQAVASP